MEHTHIVTATDLETYSDAIESEQVLPEFVSLLIRESVADLTYCRIPYGNSIGQPGYDGMVETAKGGRQFVPAGKSVWEIGTGAKPQKKATDDFRDRLKATTDADRKDVSYVAVTPHAAKWAQPAQDKWRKRRAKHGWKEIKILDGVQLADWLREYPVLGKALLKRMRLADRMTGEAVPTEHWVNLQSMARHGDPPLPPKLFLVGRDQARQRLQQLFDGQENDLLLSLESPLDVDDFVAAFLADAAGGSIKLPHQRCLLINDADTWLSMTNLKARHVLVGHPSLDLEGNGEQLALTALRRGHAIVIPVAGTAGTGGGNIIPLRSPSADQIEQCLTEAKYPLERARELRSAGAHSLAALKRHLRGMGDRPPYAGWSSASNLALASAIGRWAGNNPADQKAVEGIVGKSYGEWIEVLRPESLRADTPLTQTDEQWKVISRGEAWSALGSFLSDAALERIGKVAVEVLGERNPKFELPPDRHFAAAAEGKSLRHSTGLRRGLAETLALLGSKPGALAKSCSLGRPKTVALLAVRQLLENADWITWASLNPELPLLAEAAPDEFLDQVEAALLKDDGPFKQVFAQEGSGVFGGNYMTGLLWALETLAWSPDYLVRVVSLLGELAVIDPGGNWSNRPANSITDILLPWHYQTTASVEKRKAAVEALLSEQPEVGWKVLLSLLPNNYGVTSGNRRPAWQPLIPATHTSGVSELDYWKQVEMYADVAVRIAASDLGKLGSLIDRLPDLPAPAHNRIVEHLMSSAVVQLPEAQRTALWESLVDLVAKHRKFHDANWALPKAAVDKLAAVADGLAPATTQNSQRRLFSERDFELLDEQGSYDDQHARLNRQRDEAVAKIYAEGGIAAVLAFARTVDSPGRVGEALGRGQAGDDRDLLPGLLQSTDAVEQALVRGFVWQRYWTRKLEWVDAQPAGAWTVAQRVAFLSMLPFIEDVWQRLEKFLGTNTDEYWKAVPANNPWQSKEEKMPFAIERLLAVDRPRAAFHCLYRIAADKKPFSPELGMRVLLAAVRSKNEQFPLAQHNLVTVIGAIQRHPESNRDELFKVEWAYMEVLDHQFGGVPVVLEQRLADDPAFFVELLGFSFRSDKDKGKPRGELGEVEKAMAHNAYKVLRAWRRVPGTKPDGSFDPAAFKAWVTAATAAATKSGHLRIAQSELGQTLPYAPVDPNGLWIHAAVAEVLNGKTANAMRNGFTVELFNMRGVHGHSAGRDERGIATKFHQQADALDAAGFHRFGTAIRELAKQYERDADREAARNPFDD